MGNLDLWESTRTVPKEAIKPIQAGRLKGKSDINPIWRLRTLTEQFGPCGIGWKYTITRQWTEAGANNEVAAFVNIDLYIKVNGEWSEAIPGTGGSAFVAKESSGLHTSDECYKMALTDAISVACKALGFGADVYWQAGATKYSAPPQGKTAPPQKSAAPSKAEAPAEGVRWADFWLLCKDMGYTQEQVHKIAGVDSLQGWTKAQTTELYRKLQAMKKEGKRSA